MPDRTDSDSGFTRSIIISATAKAIFDALTWDLQGWWGAMDRPVSGVGDVFQVSWGEPWYRFKVSQFEDPHRLSWKCIDANQIIPGLDGVQKEWVGTHLHWLIEDKNKGECQLTFTHEGLTSEFICHDFCSASWDHFLSERLKTYLEG